MRTNHIILLLLIFLSCSQGAIRVDNRSGKKCSDYVLDLVSGFSTAKSGALRIDRFDLIETYLTEIASGAAAEFYQMIRERNGQSPNLLGRTIRRLEESIRKELLLCYLRGKCSMNQAVFLPFIFDNFGPTMLQNPNGNIRNYRPLGIPSIDFLYPPVLFFSSLPTDQRSDFDAVVSVFGEISILSAWLDLVSVAEKVVHHPSKYPKLANFVTPNKEGHAEWVTGFAYTYLILTRMMVQRLVLTELFDITLLPDSRENELQKALENMEKEARKLILSARPTTDQVIEKLGLIGQSGAGVNLIAKTVGLQKLLEQVSSD